MAPKRSKILVNSRKRSSVAAEVERVLRRRAERKFFDSTVGVNVGTTYSVLALSQSIVQGTGGGQRIGDNISYLRLHCSFRVDCNITATVNDLRIIVVLDKMNNGVAPVVGDLLIGTSLTSTYSAAQIKEKRFTILYDKLANVTTGGRSSFMQQRVIPLNQTASYLGTTNVVGANGKNSMWIFLVSDNNTNQPGFNMDFQIEYTDL